MIDLDTVSLEVLKAEYSDILSRLKSLEATNSTLQKTISDLSGECNRLGNQCSHQFIASDITRKDIAANELDGCRSLAFRIGTDIENGSIRLRQTIYDLLVEQSRQKAAFARERDARAMGSNKLQVKLDKANRTIAAIKRKKPQDRTPARSDKTPTWML